MNNIIEVSNLSKIFKIPIKTGNFFKDLFNPEKKEVKAVDNLSFTVKRGEILAFLGPNGAGKSTTIKMLTGILYPTDGQIQVAGFNPQKDRQKYVTKIGTVFGQKSQLLYNLPLLDSLNLFSKIYEIDGIKAKKRIQELTEMFDLKDFLDAPVRKLSLGQRMRGEIAVSLIHEPEIIFLDEPTIGLDILSKQKLRQTLLDLNQFQKTTIFLTSHDVGDVETLAERTIFINHGEIVVDKPTVELKKEFFWEKFISIKFSQNLAELKLPFGKILEFNGREAKISVDLKKESLNKVISYISTNFELDDLDVYEADLEDVISKLYEAKFK